MRRRHWFEFGDLPWLPKPFREAETGFLAVAYRLMPVLPAWADKIASALRPGERARIVDLCSGSGGAMPLIVNELARRGYDVRAQLTDLYPASGTISHPRIEPIVQPVNATRVPPQFTGIRTLFSAFHHFRPPEAQLILKNAFEQRCPICVFESGPGGVAGVLATILVPANVLMLMPFVRPFRWQYALFTYLIPILPVIITWDSIASNLRCYGEGEMRELTAGLQAPDYEWEIGRIPFLGIGLPYLVGRRR